MRSVLHFFHRNPISLSLPGILPLLPHRLQPRRREVALPIFGGSCGRRLVTGDRAKDGQGSWWGLAPVLSPQEFLCWPCAQQRERALQGGPAPEVCRGPVPVPAILPASIAEASATPQCSHRRLDQPRSASVAFTEAAERSLKLKGTEFPES